MSAKALHGSRYERCPAQRRVGRRCWRCGDQVQAGRTARTPPVIQKVADESQELVRAIEDIYRYPLTEWARDILNRQLRSGISDEMLGILVMTLRDDDRLVVVHDDEVDREPQIICSLGLFPQQEGG